MSLTQHDPTIVAVLSSALRLGRPLRWNHSPIFFLTYVHNRRRGVDAAYLGAVGEDLARGVLDKTRVATSSYTKASVGTTIPLTTIACNF